MFSFSVLFAWLALSTVLADVSNTLWDKQSGDSSSLCGRVGLESRASAKRGAKAGKMAQDSLETIGKDGTGGGMTAQGLGTSPVSFSRSPSDFEIHGLPLVFPKLPARKASFLCACCKRGSDLCQKKNLEILEGFKFFTEALPEKSHSSHNAYIL